MDSRVKRLAQWMEVGGGALAEYDNIKGKLKLGFGWAPFHCAVLLPKSPSSSWGIPSSCLSPPGFP